MAKPDPETVLRLSYAAEGLTPGNVRRFRGIIRRYYRNHGRSFPWRETHDHYRILVSEIMLQQTQTDRVIKKYERFVAALPDFAALATAPMSVVLGLWQGLGYNRRAKALAETARTVMREHGGALPSDQKQLLALPGIGKYTAAAVGAFAFGQPAAFIETNIRSVYTHFFFPDAESVHDKQIMPLVERTLDRRNPREWYYALMDYGVHLKKQFPDINKKSAHYARQSKFEGSNRQVRGRILKVLVKHFSMTEPDLIQAVDLQPERVKKSLQQLREEGFVAEHEGKLFLADE